MYVLERVRKVVLAYQHTVEAEVSGESGLLDELGDMGLRWQVRRIFVPSSMLNLTFVILNTSLSATGF